MLSHTMTLFTMEECNIMLCFTSLHASNSFYCNSKTGATYGKRPATCSAGICEDVGHRRCERPSTRNTAVAGSCRKELLRAMLAAMANIWPQRRCKACANAGRD